VDGDQLEWPPVDVEFEVQRGARASRIADDPPDRQLADAPAWKLRDHGECARPGARASPHEMGPRVEPFPAERELVERAELGGYFRDRIGPAVGSVRLGEDDDVGVERT
jgi:hypothetical protein